MGSAFSVGILSSTLVGGEERDLRRERRTRDFSPPAFSAGPIVSICRASAAPGFAARRFMSDRLVNWAVFCIPGPACYGHAAAAGRGHLRRSVLLLFLRKDGKKDAELASRGNEHAEVRDPSLASCMRGDAAFRWRSAESPKPAAARRRTHKRPPGIFSPLCRIRVIDRCLSRGQGSLSPSLASL